MERQETQEARPEGQWVFQGLFHASAIGIAVEDLEGRPLFANPALCSVLGFTEDEMRSKHCVECSPSEDAQKDWALFEQLRDGLIDHYQLEKRFIRKDGTLVWGRLSVSLMYDPASSTRRVVAMVEDVSEKRAAEEKARRSEADLQNLAGRLIQAREEEQRRIGRELHDDIGQRLSLLTVGLEELRNSLASEQDNQRQLASEIHRKTKELAETIHHLSIDLHSPKLSFLGLHFALRNLCTQISTQQHIPVTVYIDELPANLSSDLELCIFRVAQEALNNAVKHSHASEAHVELTLVEGAMVLKIRDSGVGFDPSTSHQGIGLTSMRERLRLVGGELFVESAVGNGTTIIAKVKLEKAKGATTG